MGLDWLVLKCQSCELAFGKSRHAKDLHCPHCNHVEAKVLSRHMNANEASNAVSSSNVPSEIREQLSSRLKEQVTPKSPQQSEPIDGHSILSLAVDEDGIVTLDSLKKVLGAMNFPMNAETFAEQACAEGELLREGPNLWKRA